MVSFRRTSAGTTVGGGISLLLLVLQKNALLVDAALDCTLSNPIDLDDGLILQQVVNNDAGTFTMKMTYTGGNSWLGIGINTEGKNAMFPGTAVIGHVETDGTMTVGHYALTSEAKDASGVNLISADSSLFTDDSSFVQPDESTSELTFTFPLEKMGVQDESVWIYAVGIPTNFWEKEHKIVGAFRVALTPCVTIPDPPTAAPTFSATPAPTVNATEPLMDDDEQGTEPSLTEPPTPAATTPPPAVNPSNTIYYNDVNNSVDAATTSSSGIQLIKSEKPYRNLWCVHGILMAAAWAFFAPVAVGASILRNALDKFQATLGITPESRMSWYSIHYYGNVMTLLLTLIGFFISVAATQKEGDMHFHNDHKKTGLVITIFCVIQSLGGYFRPDLPRPPKSNNDDATEAPANGDNNNNGVGINVSFDSSFEQDQSNKNRSNGQGEDESVEVPLSMMKKSVAGNNKTSASKSTIRIFWEYFHRTLGLVLLALAWWNCDTGIEKQLKFWPDTPDWENTFWGITGGIACFIVFMGYVVRV